MPLPDSGVITTEMIRAEFGGDRPFDMRNYYAGGAHVPAGTTGRGGHPVPSSGQIAHSDFYGTSNYKPGSITFDTVGVHYWDAPPYVKKITVKGIGGGGSGGGVTSNNGCIDRFGGGGGGSSGVFMRDQVFNIQGGVRYTVRVGAGGAGVAAGGNNGGATTIDGVLSIGGGVAGGSGQSCSYFYDGDFKAGGATAGANSGGKGYRTPDGTPTYFGGVGATGWSGSGGSAGGAKWTKSAANGGDATGFGSGGGGGAISETMRTTPAPEGEEVGTQTSAGGSGSGGFITISW